MDKNEQKALADIAQYGCHILHILEDDEGPGFSYSIGIEKHTKHPDIVIVGLQHELAQSMINAYHSRVKNGEVFAPLKYYDGFLEGFDVTFVEVSKEHYETYFGWGSWYNKGNDFSMLQMVYPTTQGIWPWDEDASKEFRWIQPLLQI